MRGWIALACALGGCQLDWDALIGDGDAAVDADLIDAATDAPIDAGPDVRADSGLVGGEITQVSAGGHHTCAILGGELLCWGRNDRGQLGVGHRGAHDGAVIVSLVGVKQVSAGALHTCAIDATDTLYCWGEPSGSRLGTGELEPQDAPTTPILDDVRHVSAGVEHSCAVTLDGVVFCWGTEQAGETSFRGEQPSPRPVTFPRAVLAEEVVAGNDHTCARISGGTVWCWGEDELRGDGDGTATSEPVAADIEGAAKIVSGLGHVCALLDDGTVACWGNGFSGEIGSGTTRQHTVPEPVSSLAGVTDIAAGGHHTCASTGDGALHCWGRGLTGALGVDTQTATTPVEVPGFSAAGPIAAGGAGLEDHTCAVDATGELSCWGYRAWGQLGDGYRVAHARPTMVLGAVANVSPGAGHLCWGNGMAVDCLGRNDETQSGDPRRIPVSSARRIGISGVATAVGVGARHGCAIAETGSELWCWGAGESGQLGHGAPAMRAATPVEVTGVTSGSAWRDVVGGARHTCAIRDDNSVHCWGDGTSGALGNGMTSTSASPRLAIASGATAVALGTQFTCAIVSGNVQCWGAGGRGQRGVGDLTDSAVPATVSDLPAAPVALGAGIAHACAATADGVYCWGEGSHGQLGSAMPDPAASPVFVPAAVVSPVRALALGEGHSCALGADLLVWCWGRNDYGQLGRGTYDSVPGPVVVEGLTGVLGIAAYDHQTCARTATSLECWGMAAEGRIVPAGGTPLFVVTPTDVTIVGD